MALPSIKAGIAWPSLPKLWSRTRGSLQTSCGDTDTLLESEALPFGVHACREGVSFFFHRSGTQIVSNLTAISLHL